MLILLPPSEGKAETRRGKRLDLASLVFADALTETRHRVMAALSELCADDPEKAREVLDLTPGQAGDLVRNLRLQTAPTLPAAQLYTGVLYDYLGLLTLPAQARRRANRTVLISSGLWGVLRPQDRVPPYRLSGGATLPALGTVAGIWRAPLAQVLPDWAGRKVVLDLRSGTYAAAWRPAPPVVAKTVTVQVTQNGKVVSHHNKATKGLLARALLCSGVDPKTPAALAEACAAAGFPGMLIAPPRAGGTWQLSIDQV
ncbi:MAG TPA: peroxide stress protein YaaA [Sporichthya sp.]|nr:peroxide stress protein YaaA [Sporichthya sp.]